MNKNTKARNRIFRKARKNGEVSVTLNVPVYNYHSVAGGKSEGGMRPQTFNVAGATEAPRRNMRQRVYHNRGDALGTGNNSLTAHEPIQNDRPIVHLNHGYMKGAYRQTAV